MKLHRELRLVAFLVLLLSVQSYAQYGYFGNYGVPVPANIGLLEDIEQNKVFPRTLRDLGVMLSGTTEYGVSTGSVLQSISGMKRFGAGFLRMRYTPGFNASFTLRREEQFSGGDSTGVSLSTAIEYLEVSAGSYGYSLNNSLSLGISVHQFSQKVRRDNFGAVVKPDTVYLVSDRTESMMRTLRFDIATEYAITQQFRLQAGMFAFSVLNSGQLSEDDKQYKLPFKRTPFIRAEYISSNSSALLHAETSGFLQFSGASAFQLWGGSLGLGITVTHAEKNTTFIRSVTPFLSFGSGFWQLGLSATTFYPTPATVLPISKFLLNEMVNLKHHEFSFNSISITAQAAISFKPEKKVRITNVEVFGPVFSALHDQYLTSPLARVSVTNISAEPVTVKPVILFQRMSPEKVYAPFISVAPGDTIEIPVYYSLADSFSGKGSSIASVVLSVLTASDEPDDEVAKPILVYGKNAWDGNPATLRYFVMHDLPQSVLAAREQLRDSKIKTDTAATELLALETLKIIFNSTISGMSYVADPRASSETVQYPTETLRLKGGDCDDLSVCIASLLEASGIDCAFVAFHNSEGEGHINLLVNTGIPADKAALLTENDNYYVVRKNANGMSEIWLPLETTRVTGFEQAWERAALRFRKEAIDNFGLAKRTVELFDIY